MTALRVLRFFAAVSPPPAALIVVMAVLVAGAAVLEAVHAGSSDWVLASIALLQLFAAATGFTRHASRGYYDPVLASRARDWRVPLWHLAVAAAPGAAAWIVTGLTQAAAAGSFEVPAFRPPGWTALLLVSAVPWAASLRTAPLLPGALWLLASAAAIASGRIFPGLGRLRADPGWANREPLEALGVALAFPAGVPSFVWPSPLLASMAAIAVLAIAAGVRAITRCDFPLSEEGD